MNHYVTHITESTHDQITRIVLQFFKGDPSWHLPRADLPGELRPLTYRGRIPDVTAYYGVSAALCLVEVETAESYNSPHAIEQYRTFAHCGHLVICVPAQVEVQARILLTLLGIRARIFGYEDPGLVRASARFIPSHRAW